MILRAYLKLCRMIRQPVLLQVLLRALRDFNLGKLTADDTGIFMGLLNDIFPKTLESVPRAINQGFETHVSSAEAWRTCSFQDTSWAYT